MWWNLFQLSVKKGSQTSFSSTEGVLTSFLTSVLMTQKGWKTRNTRFSGVLSVRRNGCDEVNKEGDSYESSSLWFRSLSVIKKNNHPIGWLKKSVGVDLSSRAASSQVFSALLSLTTVFGMGTGGPSTSSTPTKKRNGVFWMLDDYIPKKSVCQAFFKIFLNFFEKPRKLPKILVFML